MADTDHSTSHSRRAALKAGVVGMAWLVARSPLSPALVQEFAQMTREHPMTGARFVSILQSERTQWNTLLGQIDPTRLEESGVTGTWSVKDIIAHLSWYERRVVEGAQQVMSTGTFTRPPQGQMTMDERNAVLATESHERPLHEVLAESDQTFSDLLAVAASFPEHLLNETHRFKLPDGVTPWMAVANNTYIHYREHASAIRDWLERSL